MATKLMPLDHMPSPSEIASTKPTRADSLKAMCLTPMPPGTPFPPVHYSGMGASGRIHFQGLIEPGQIVIFEHLLVHCDHKGDCDVSPQMMFQCLVANHVEFKRDLKRVQFKLSGISVHFSSGYNQSAEYRFGGTGARGRLTSQFDTLSGRTIEDALLQQRQEEDESNVELLNVMFNEYPVAPILDPPYAVRLESGFYQYDGPEPEEPELLISISFALRNSGKTSRYVVLDAIKMAKPMPLPDVIRMPGDDEDDEDGEGGGGGGDGRNPAFMWGPQLLNPNPTPTDVTERANQERAERAVREAAAELDDLDYEGIEDT